MIKLKFMPLSYESFDWKEKNYVRIYGRDEKGKKVCLIDSFLPYLYAILEEGIGDKEIVKIEKKIQEIEIKGERRTTKIEKIKEGEKSYLGKKVKALKIFISNYKDAHDVADNLDIKGIEARREYDIPIITKYLIDKKLNPLECFEVEADSLEAGEFNGIENIEVDRIFKIKSWKKIESFSFSPKVIAFDIETEEFEIGRGEILMISIATDKIKKVLTWKRCRDKPDFVEYYHDEAEMIEAFLRYVKSEDIDFLTGYFSDGFDLQYLRARAEKNHIKLSLGLDGSQPSFTRGIIPTGSIEGIVHIDLFRFIDTNYSQYLQSETLGLNEVAQELLGEGKRDFEFKKSHKINDEGWKDYFSYNMQDSILTYKLFEKLWTDLKEMTLMLKEPPFNVSRDRMSQHVEDYILHNLERFDEIAEKRPIHDEIAKRRQREKYEGAFVFQPIPSLYEDVAAFDFTSMYGSIINSFNLSRASFLGYKISEKEKKESYKVEMEYEGEKEFYFSKEKSFFPILIGELIERRKQLKKELKENFNEVLKARSNAAKLLVNASYGYLGFFGARYYCPEAAAATAALARKFALEVIDKINGGGYKVIYSDTDSCFFLMNNKSKDEVLKLLKELNKNLPGMMELELEDFYKRGIWTKKRTTEAGAKKKYALIDDKNKIKIRGFETVRRDWCDLARELQSRVLEMILKEGNEKNALELLKRTIKDIKERKIDRKKIMIKTQLKKLISEYKARTPHVIAAEKMKEKGMPLDVGRLIEYFIAETREKKELVRDKVKLPDEKGEYNIDYYLNNQIIPAVENIFEIFNVDVKELVEGKKQKKLLDF